MQTSEAGVALIKEFEGFPYNGRPYQDMVKVWTIGFGHTEGVGPHSKPITIQQASELLRQDLDKKYAPSLNALRLPFGQHQFDALVSFVYNCGPGAVGADTHVGMALRAKQWHAAADALLMWNKAGGRPVAGLTRRRQAERAMFLEDDNPLEGFTDSEKSLIQEFDRLGRQGKGADRRNQLSAQMLAQRKRIWRAAQPPGNGGDGHGWDHADRRARYAALLARTS